MFSLELDKSLTHNFLPNLKLSNNFLAKVMYFASKPACCSKPMNFKFKFLTMRRNIQVKALNLAIILRVKFMQPCVGTMQYLVRFFRLF